MMQDEKTNGVLERFLAREERHTSFDLVEHPCTHLSVPKEMNFSARRDAAGLYLADIVQQRRPSNFQLGDSLTDDLLGMLPNVLVPPLAVAEANHRLHLRHDGSQGPAS